MIVTVDQDNGIERVWMTRFASVTTYFTREREGEGIELHIEPGFAADPVVVARIAHDVRAAVIDEVAQRLGIAPDMVFQQPFLALKKVADPALHADYRYARRSKNRSYPRH